MAGSTFLKISFLVLLFSACARQAIAQQADSLANQFLIKLELRPRAEYTSNYILPPNDSANRYLYVTQRNRLSMLYARKKWLVKSDFQEIHLWDVTNKTSRVAGINFYQLYLESKFKHFNVRVGRQAVLLDNGRLFSDAPWSQQGRAHEGVRFMNASNHISNDFFFLFTRKYHNAFDAAYSPVAAHHYKYLFVNYFNYHTGKLFSLNSITAIDFFKDEGFAAAYARATAGARAEITGKQWYYTLNAYLQFGHTPQGKKLLAWYLQPEIKLSLKKPTLRLGAEILSGSNPRLAAGHSGDFDVLYGVVWKFMGNINMFTSFPKDVAGKGLINPYLFMYLPVNKELLFRSDFHLFFTQYHLLNNGQQAKRFLGFENDLSLKYQLLKNVEVNYSFCFYLPSNSMQFLPKMLNENKPAIWNYLMVSYSPTLLSLKRHTY